MHQIPEDLQNTAKVLDFNPYTVKHGQTRRQHRKVRQSASCVAWLKDLGNHAIRGPEYGPSNANHKLH